MQRLRSRINPHSLGDLAVWIFVAMFFMIFTSGLVIRMESGGEEPGGHGQALQMGSFVAVGLIFLGARKLVSRKMKAELDAGNPGRVATVHAIAMSLLGGMSVLFFVSGIVLFTAAKYAGDPAAEEVSEISSRIMFVGMAGVAPLLAGLWAGWRAGFAGWTFGGVSYLILWLPSLPFPQRSSVWVFAIGLLVAGAGGHIGALIYARRGRPQAAGAPSEQKEQVP